MMATEFTVGDLGSVIFASWSRRILVNAHRQSGKTVLAARLAAAYAAGRLGEMVLVVAPSHRMIAHLFGKAGGLFPERTGTSVMLGNGSQVTCLEARYEAIAGLPPADAIIVDEAARVSDDVHDLLDSMLSDDGAGGRLIKLSTPNGARGRFHADWTGDDPWERHEVKASRNSRVDQEWLARQRAILSPRQYAQDFECEFLEAAVPA